MDQFDAESFEILNEAKQAQKALRSENYPKVSEFLQHMTGLERHEIEILLADVRLQSDQTLFFDLKEYTAKIYEELRVAKEDFDRQEYKKVGKLLKFIISVEKSAIKEKKSHSAEIKLATIVALDTAIIMTIRGFLDAYVQQFGKTVDAVEYYMHVGGETISTIGSWFNFGKESEQELVQEKTEMKKEDEQGYKTYSEQPVETNWTFYQDNSWQHTYSDYLYFVCLAALAGKVVLRDLPRYVKRKFKQHSVNKEMMVLQAKVHNLLKTELLSIRDMINSETTKVRELELKLKQLDQKISGINRDHTTVQEYKEVVSIYEELKRESLSRVQETKKLIRVETERIIQQAAEHFATQIQA
ncbi:hypothetical protein H8D36_01245 [archaeon]|nr:hypothetical protein [archaeon]MBL7057312.1 hypothetical protein [Candidatus Woesearchaeota archaeon]